MKFLTAMVVIGLSRFSLLVVADEMAEMAKMLHDSCVSETGVNEELIQQTKTGQFEEDDKLKCYMKCIFLQIGAMSEEGVVDVDAFIAAMPENVKNTHGPDMLKKCHTIEAANACEKAFNLNKCFYQYKPESYMIV